VNVVVEWFAFRRIPGLILGIEIGHGDRFYMVFLVPLRQGVIPEIRA
jgi:hypothetical protein